ncbi:MAG TPA: FixH family protein [Kofleriaceae bacterium]|jgi:nitrogen fixation protein FixH
MTPARKWIVAITGLLGANVLASVALAMTAAHGSSQVIPDYYERAVHYDDAIDQAATDRRLGWHVDTAVTPAGLVVHVRDAAGAPLAGATIDVTGYQRAHASTPFHLTPGAGPVALPVHGVCDIALVVTRGTDRFAVQRTIEVP